jgi:hypothetical protein
LLAVVQRAMWQHGRQARMDGLTKPLRVRDRVAMHRLGAPGHDLPFAWVVSLGLYRLDQHANAL